MAGYHSSETGHSCGSICVNESLRNADSRGSRCHCNFVDNLHFGHRDHRSNDCLHRLHKGHTKRYGNGCMGYGNLDIALDGDASRQRDELVRLMRRAYLLGPARVATCENHTRDWMPLTARPSFIWYHYSMHLTPPRSYQQNIRTHGTTHSTLLERSSSSPPRDKPRSAG